MAPTPFSTGRLNEHGRDSYRGVRDPAQFLYLHAMDMRQHRHSSHRDGGYLPTGDYTENADEYVKGTRSGADAILAAVDNLPPSGGVVHVPAFGPDRIQSGGKTYKNIWHLPKTLDIGEANKGVILQGEGQGVGGDMDAGTRIVTDQSISTMVRFPNGRTSGLRDLTISGLNSVQFGVEFGYEFTSGDLGGKNPGRFFLDRVGIQDCNSKLIEVDADGGQVRINNSILSGCTSGNALRVKNYNDHYLWVTNSTFENNSRDIDLSAASFKGCALKNLEFLNGPNCDNTTYSVNLGGGEGIAVKDCYWSTPAEDIVQILNSISNFEFSGWTIDQSDVNYVLDNDNGAIIRDGEIFNINARAVNGSKYSPRLINETYNARRVLFNGLGYNNGDPSSTGRWNGEGREGVRVLWSNGGTPTISEYVNGTWYARAL